MSGWSMRSASASRADRASARCAVSSLVVCIGLFAGPLGCAPAVPSFPPLPVDAGIECDEDTPCGTGENCLQGICYPACDATHACGPRESCMSGVCILRTGDAGMRDASLVDAFDPCDTVECVAPTAMCREGRCIQCTASSDCGGLAPICDVGRGQCVAFEGSPCAPCTNDLDCSPVGGAVARCIARVAPEPSERVCLASCEDGASCPAGFQCEAGRALCVPLFGQSCTGYYAGVRSRACTMDGDCSQIGATIDTGLVTGACVDDGAGSVCHYACGLPSDCPPPFTMCTGGFCRP